MVISEQWQRGRHRESLSNLQPCSYNLIERLDAPATSHAGLTIDVKIRG